MMVEPTFYCPSCGRAMQRDERGFSCVSCLKAENTAPAQNPQKKEAAPAH